MAGVVLFPLTYPGILEALEGLLPASAYGFWISALGAIILARAAYDIWLEPPPPLTAAIAQGAGAADDDARPGTRGRAPAPRGDARSSARSAISIPSQRRYSPPGEAISTT